ncbi:hypothetical protein OCK74_15780 [Chitinophagaceae bacterium LB-8]|uniref:Fibronectin type-III domain-containing protein n=1 Tax=Paraflavisolibacter caeni TaxID=2982496 RepID=A0A9X2XWA3_9BACT|nr:hypothetical protein [Paraflavisolibacter caeni]MCU7550579.1 hypothetical protein [Paraflavisolibacter caeni]
MFGVIVSSQCKLMSTPILTNGFDDLSDYSLKMKASNIISKMAGNSNFPKPTPALEDISTTLSEFMKENNLIYRIQKRQKLIRLLQSLAGYVSYIADRDQQKLISSGFDIRFEQQAPVEIGKPENLQVAAGRNPGELQLSSSRVVGAIFYNFQYTVDPITPNSLWISHIESANKFILKNLEKGKKYWCRVGAVSMNEKVTFSDAVEGLVQ